MFASDQLSVEKKEESKQEKIDYKIGLSIARANKVEYYVNDLLSEVCGCDITFTKAGQHGLILAMRINRQFILNKYGVEWQSNGSHAYTLFHNNAEYKKDLATFGITTEDSQFALKQLYSKNLLLRYKSLKSILFVFSERYKSVDLEFLTEGEVLKEYEERKAAGELILKSEAERIAESIGVTTLSFPREEWDIFSAAIVYKISVKPKEADFKYFEQFTSYLVSQKVIPEEQVHSLREVLGIPSRLPLVLSKEEKELESILPAQFYEQLKVFHGLYPSISASEILKGMLTWIMTNKGVDELRKIFNLKNDGDLKVGEKLAFWAIKYEDEGLIDILRRHDVNVNMMIKDDRGRTLVHHASCSNKWDKFICTFPLVFLKARDHYGSQALHYAAKSGASVIVLTILNKLDSKLAADYKDKLGDTPLHHAVARLGDPNPQMNREYIKIIKMLLCAGHSEYMANQRGKTPFQLAQELLPKESIKNIFTRQQLNRPSVMPLSMDDFEHLEGIDASASERCSVS